MKTLSLACCVVGFAIPHPCSAEDQAGLAALVERQLGEVVEYIAENPDASDVGQAYLLAFETAQKHGLQHRVMELADQYVELPDTKSSTVKLAKQVRVLGLARAGKTAEAVGAFGDVLKGVSVRMPDDALATAKLLASELQVAGDASAARSTYDRLSTAFFLNSFVRRLCDGRITKLQMVGEDAPALASDSVSGDRVDLGELKGKLVLVDFWATNCPPCLEEFPKLKKLYADYHAKGFEVIGVSLDEEQENVDRFQEKWKLPWPLVVSIQGRGPIRSRYRVETIPSMFLVDKTGKVIAADLTSDALRRAVAKHLAE